MLLWTAHLNAPTRSQQVAVTVGHCVYSFGGYKDHFNVHVFNTVSLSWRKLTPAGGPLRRYGHTAVLVDYTVYLWGGIWCNALDAFNIDDHTWHQPQVSGNIPEARQNHSACVLGKVMLIHGGLTRTITNDLYKLDTSTMVWTFINAGGTKPPVSIYHSATIIGTKMFVFGGRRFSVLDYARGWRILTIRVFDSETNRWLEAPSAQLHPEGRCGHVAFTYNGELYIFSGWNDYSNYCNDLWKFKPETSCCKYVEPKGLEVEHKAKCLIWPRTACGGIVGDRAFLFGAQEDRPGSLHVLDFSPNLKTLSKLAVVQYDLECSELPHNLRWELAAMTASGVWQSWAASGDDK